MRKRKYSAILLGILFFILSSVRVMGANKEETYPKEVLENVDFEEIDTFMKEKLFSQSKNRITFSELVEKLFEEGMGGFDYSMLLAWGKDAVLFEIEQNRQLLVQIVLLAVGFSILRNYSNAFRSSYISDLSFFLVYCVLAILLLQSFSSFREIVTDTLCNSVAFMQALVPTFCVTMMFSSGVGTLMGFYQIAFLTIYLIQWLFLKVLMPCIHIFVIFELFNHFFEDEKFQNLTELLKGFVCWGIKIAGGIVLGLNVVQNLIAPARDRLVNGTMSKAAAAMPGIGNSINGVSELLLGSGILIKNCVGVAALLILVLIGVVPILKILVMSFFYKIAAAVTEPMADKRITGCLRGMAEGGVLYLKLIVYCLILFFLMIALTTAASSFIY